MSKRCVPARQRRYIEDHLREGSDADQLIDAASHLLSELSQQVADLTGAVARVAASFADAIDDANDAAAESDRILATGSFYVVGPVLSELYSRRTS